LSYGPLSNDFLLMDYGFVIPDNPHDRVALRFDMDLINVSGQGYISACTAVRPSMACACHASALVRKGRR
jgi:hypothetical protein